MYFGPLRVNSPVNCGVINESLRLEFWLRHAPRDFHWIVSEVEYSYSQLSCKKKKRRKLNFEPILLLEQMKKKPLKLNAHILTDVKW